LTKVKVGLGLNAFYSSKELTIYAPKDSYAEAFAKDNFYSFVAE